MDVKPDTRLSKDVDGYDGYAVTVHGKVWSDKTNKYLKSAVNSEGYRLVNLHKDGKGKVQRVHVLVAKAFIPNPETHTEVNHKDGDKANNAVYNLEWCTRRHNVQHSNRRKWSSLDHTAGVRYNERLHKYQAFIRVNGEEIYLGVYSTKEDAITAKYAAQKVVLKAVGND